MLSKKPSISISRIHFTPSHLLRTSWSAVWQDRLGRNPCESLTKTGGSSPCLRPGLSLSTVSHYALPPVVFISQTIRHPLNQLDLVIEPLGHPVTVTMSNVMG